MRFSCFLCICGRNQFARVEWNVEVLVLRGRVDYVECSFWVGIVIVEREREFWAGRNVFFGGSLQCYYCSAYL